MTTGPVTYGQLSVLRSLDIHGPAHQHVANLTEVWDIPAGVSTAQVIDAWLQLVKAHDSLRTSYDRSGPRPVQIVHQFEFRRVPTVEVEADTEAAVRQIAAEWAADAISTEDLPWRTFVATFRGEPCRLAVVIHHVAADDAALKVLGRQFRHLLSGGSLGPMVQPLDMAREQQESPGAAARSVQQWTESWAQLVVEDRHPYDDSERRRAAVYSVDALVAAQTLSERLRVSVQSVVLGVGALALARHEQRSRITFALMAANRLDPRWSELVSSLNQYAPITLDVGDDRDPESFLQACYRECLNAYMNASYDVDELKESLRRAGHDEADPTAFAKHFNFLGEMESEPGADSALGRGVEWRPSTQRSGPNLHLVAAVGKGLLVGVGASVGYLGGDLPAGVATSIQAGLVNVASSRATSLRDVRLDSAPA